MRTYARPEREEPTPTWVWWSLGGAVGLCVLLFLAIFLTSMLGDRTAEVAQPTDGTAPATTRTTATAGPHDAAPPAAPSLSPDVADFPPMPSMPGMSPTRPSQTPHWAAPPDPAPPPKGTFINSPLPRVAVAAKPQPERHRFPGFPEEDSPSERRSHTAGATSRMARSVAREQATVEFAFSARDAALCLAFPKREPFAKELPTGRLLDLLTGQVQAEVPSPSPGLLLAINADGSRFLWGRRDERTVDPMVLEVWSCPQPGDKPRVSWNSEKLDDGGEASFSRPSFPGVLGSIEAATFIDNEHVLTTTSFGEVLVWDLTSPPVRLAYRLERPTGVSQCQTFSPGRKYLLCSHDHKIDCHVALTGTWLGEFAAPSDQDSFAAVFVSPDGTRLAGITNWGTRNLIVWDWATAKVVLHTEAPRVDVTADRWLNDDYILAGGTLVSLQHKLAVWRYPALDLDQAVPDNLCWALRDKSLVPLAIPSSQVLQAIEDGLARDPPLLKPGDAVSVEVDIQAPSPPTDFREKLIAAATSGLQAAGYTTKGPPALTLRITATEKATGEMVKFAPFFGNQQQAQFQIPDQQLITDLKLCDSQGKSWWATTLPTSLFGVLVVGDAKSVEEFTALALAQRWDNLLGALPKIPIPQRLYRWSSEGAMGESTFNDQGQESLRSLAESS